MNDAVLLGTLVILQQYIQCEDCWQLRGISQLRAVQQSALET